MKHILKFPFLFSLLLLMNACAPSHEEKQEREAASADTLSGPETFSSPEASGGLRDSARKFIRTADLRFKVKDVLHSTLVIEDIVSRNQGFVTESNLSSNVEDKKVVKVSRDSSLETVHFQVQSSIVLRVPNHRLDTVLKAFSSQVEFMDYRVIRADDASLRLLSSRLERERLRRHENRLEKAIDDRGKKLGETAGAEDYLLNRREQSDQALLHNLSLADQVNYSTVSVSIYQKHTISRNLVYTGSDTSAYEPGIFSKIAEAFVSGWKILEAFVLFLIRIWGILLVIAAALLLYRYMARKTTDPVL
jgi:hypothetical protein